MNRGYYYAANGMIMNQRKLDCIGNNLANMSTSGYRRDTILTNRFDEAMILVKSEKYDIVQSGRFCGSLQKSNFCLTNPLYGYIVICINVCNTNYVLDR